MAASIMPEFREGIDCHPLVYMVETRACRSSRAFDFDIYRYTKHALHEYVQDIRVVALTKWIPNCL